MGWGQSLRCNLTHYQTSCIDAGRGCDGEIATLVGHQSHGPFAAL